MVEKDPLVLSLRKLAIKIGVNYIDTLEIVEKLKEIADNEIEDVDTVIDNMMKSLQKLYVARKDLAKIIKHLS